MPLDALPTIRVPTSVHHMRALLLQIILLQAQNALQVIVQVLDFEDFGTLLLLIGKVFPGGGALAIADHHNFDLFSVVFPLLTREHR